MRYLLFRLLIIILCFSLVSVYEVGLEFASPGSSTSLIKWLLTAYMAFAVASMFFVRRLMRGSDSMRWQVVSDFLFQSALVWTTGGVLSVFSPLLFVTLAAATSLTTARGSFLLATLATAVLTAAMAACAFEVAPWMPGDIEGLVTRARPTFIVTYLAANVLGLYAVSILGSLLSSGLRSLEGIQSEILENMAEGLIAINRNGQVVHANKELRKIFGMSTVPRHGKVKVEDVLPGERFADLRRLLESGERRRFETTVFDPQGEERPIEVKVSSAADHKGQQRYRIGLVSDLTLKREVEAAERRIQKLEELQVMAMGIAHEIRNPLASIRGCVQEIARLTQCGIREHRFMEIICRESDRLDRIIEDFLRYARSGPADLLPVDFTEVIEEAVLLIKSRSEFGARELRWSPPVERPRVFGDRNRLIQLFLNLGINAIEATDPNGGRINVVIRPRVSAPSQARKSGGKLASGVEVEFSDNGSGIEDADLKRVFTPFFTTKPGGSGLGLSIVEKIVSEHHGALDVQSAKGEGTTVHIWLPALARSLTPPAAAEETAGVREIAELVCHG
jgi:PAS domain S-box-containing protein